MRRQYVHLTTDRELAQKVGARHGTAALIYVDAKHAHEVGLPFYRANERFWLAQEVPPEFLSLEPPV